MGVNPKAIWSLFKASVSAWSEDKSPRMGASLSFYTIFAMPPLFMIAIFIASVVFDPDAVRTQMFSEVGGLIGQKSAEAINSAMAAQYQANKGAFASTLAVLTLIVTTTGLFIELQDSLNTIWKVEARPGRSIVGFIRVRLLSFAMVVGVAFLLLVSLIVSAGLAALSRYINELLPGLGILSVIANDLVSFLVITVLFAMIFKILPDVRIAWRDVWVGGAVTSLLFTAGKFLLGWYLGRSSTVSAYGAAGSIVLVLLWVYYSAQILFFGAEITKVYATRFGTGVKPDAHARWVAEGGQARQSGRVGGERFAPAEAVSKVQGTRDGRRSAGGTRHTTQAERQARLVSELREEIESLRAIVRH